MQIAPIATDNLFLSRLLLIIELKIAFKWNDLIVPLQYSVAIKNASKNIKHIQKKVSNIKNILGKIKQHLDMQDKVVLLTIHKLLNSLKECFL